MKIIYYLICVISMVLCGGTFTGMCMEQLLPIKENGLSAPKRILCWTLVSTVTMLVKGAVMNAQNAALTVAFVNVFVIGSGLIMTWKFYGGKSFKKYRVYVALLLMCVAGDMTYGMMYQLFMGHGLTIPSYNSASAALGCMGAAVIGSIYMVLFVRFSNREMRGRKLYDPVLIVLLTVLISAGFAASGETQETYDAAFIFVCSCVLFFLYLCLCIFFAMEHIRTTIRDQEAFYRALEMEQMRYEAFKVRREELSKLRHDYKNLLSTVKLLLEKGDTLKAKELLCDMTLRAGMVETEEEKYG